MAPPEQVHNCARCGQPLRYIDSYGTWYCYVCQSYESPEVQQFNVCPTCHQPLTYLEPYSAYYCYTCQQYQLPQAPVTTYGTSGSYIAAQPTDCGRCGKPLQSGTCYYCLADEMIAAAESSIGETKRSGASVGKTEEKLLHARRLVAENKPDQAITVAEEAEEDAKDIREKHKTAKRMMTQLEDDLDKLAQKEVNTSTADNQLQLARNFMRSGNYEKTIEFLTKAQTWCNEQAEKIGLRQKGAMVKRPRYQGLYPACPECGNVVKKENETCPFCDALLYEEVPASQVQAAAPVKAHGDDDEIPSGHALGMRSMMSEKDVGTVPIAPGVETKPSIPVSPTKPVAPAPTPAPPAKEGVCPNCGEEVEPDWTKCPFCSGALGSKAAAPAPAPAPTPAPAPAPVAPAKPPSVKCTSCGSDVEAGWKRCPVCMSPVKAPAPVPTPAPPTPPPPKPVAPTPPTPMPPKPVAPMPPPKPVAPPPPTPPPPTVGKPGAMPVVMPPPPPAGGMSSGKIEQELKGIEEEVKAMDAKGVNTAHAKNLVRLAQSFMKGGAPDKAQRYVRKARQSLDELKAEQAGK